VLIAMLAMPAANIDVLAILQKQAATDTADVARQSLQKAKNHDKSCRCAC
jgi:hypothetical protein